MSSALPEFGSDYVWIWRGQVAIVLGSVVFALLFLPIVIRQYRVYGSLSGRRLLGAAAASIYLTSVISYTVLPLPDPDDVICRTPTLDAFHFVDDLQRANIGPGLQGLLTSRIALQILLNIVLFIPWGIWVRGYMGRSLITATLSGAGVSTLLELTQGTGLWGLYPCPYRVADIDDIILNTTGAFIGAVIAPLVMFWMPRHAELARKRLVPRPITVWRRWMSMILEFGGLVVISALVVVGARFADSFFGWDVVDQHGAALDVAGALLAWSVVFALPALFRSGSLGLRALWLAPRWPAGTRALPVLGLARASVVSGPWVLAETLGWWWLSVLFWIMALAAVASVPFTADRRGLTCMVTGARLVDVRADPDAPVGGGA